jgi:hypothetical protein
MTRILNVPTRVYSPLAACGVLLAISGSLWSQSTSRFASVVKVSARADQHRLPGSGFVVALRNGTAWIITSAHVVARDPRPSVEFQADPDRTFSASLVNRQDDDLLGLALLKVNNAPGTVRVLPRGQVSQGMRAQAVGYPISSGRLSVLDLNIVRTEGEELILSLETPEGYSGGPVIAGNAAVGLVFGTEKGAGKALRLSRIQGYLEGYDIVWDGAVSERQDEPPPKDPPRPVIDLSGTWRDNTLGLVSQIVQSGDTITATGAGVGCLGAFRSIGSGTVKNGQFENSYRATYSTGSCSGRVSPDGRQMITRCVDSVCGEFISTAVKQ